MTCIILQFTPAPKIHPFHRDISVTSKNAADGATLAVLIISFPLPSLSFFLSFQSFKGTSENVELEQIGGSNDSSKYH